ncbi:MAG: hypothetical protein KGL74_11990, partial [Elusimicrobia bacterium]|nr:hypothetical protein [Elusimicrobiota bacterium]
MMRPRTFFRRLPVALRGVSLSMGLVLLASSVVQAAATRYDVLYLWHGTLPQAQQRRKAVAGVLGPRVAR